MNTTLCYVEKDGQYLMLHRTKKKEDISQGKWIGIGGHVEPGESPQDCVLREVLEETGLVMKRFLYRGLITFIFDDLTEYMHLFTCTAFEGSIKECDEGNLEWVQKEFVTNLPIWEGDKIFLNLIKNPCPFFSLKLVYDKAWHLLQHILYDS